MTEHTVRVWDLPTRIFHWALAVCFLGLIVTGNVGGRAMVLHMRIGHAVLALLVFRIVWGLVGGRWSRFRAFAYSPARLLRYLRGQGGAEDDVGHSPLGALSVFALLALLLVQVLTGLMSDDEIAFAGPLAAHVSNAVVGFASAYHAGPGPWLLLALVAVHVLAVLFYVRVRGQRLVRPMIDGDKRLAAPAPAARDDWVSRSAALLILALSIALARWVYSLAAPAF